MIVKIIKIHEDAVIPNYQTSGSSGFDIHAVGEYTLIPKDRKIIKTGLKMAIPEGYELQIRSRSGLTFKQGLVVANSPGTVDADYRGEIGVILTNSSTHTIHVSNGDRVAQGVVCPILQVKFDVVDTLDETERGEGGWGSTDKKE